MKHVHNKNIVFLLIAVVFAAIFIFSAIMLIGEKLQIQQETETFEELSTLKLLREDASAQREIQPAASPEPASHQKATVSTSTVNPSAPMMRSAAPNTEWFAEATPAEETKLAASGKPVSSISAATETAAADPDAAMDEDAAEDAEIPDDMSLTEEPKDPVEETTTEATSNEPVILEKYSALYERNHDFFGWLIIPDTNIDYPVMFSPDRPLEYLKHDFYGKTSYAGVPFLDADCDPNGGYYLVYGHRMRTGIMFAGLINYEKQSFWETHSTLLFDTLYEERTYLIVLAMRARVLNREETGFRYYSYTSLDTESDFEEYMQQAKKLALYDTGVSVSFGDEILVLSTCDHYTSGGRFVIVAKRIS